MDIKLTTYLNISDITYSSINMCVPNKENSSMFFKGIRKKKYYTISCNITFPRNFDFYMKGFKVDEKLRDIFLQLELQDIWKGKHTKVWSKQYPPPQKKNSDNHILISESTISKRKEINLLRILHSLKKPVKQHRTINVYIFIFHAWKGIGEKRLSNNSILIVTRHLIG